jgi:hypothetical protein
MLHVVRVARTVDVEGVKRKRLVSVYWFHWKEDHVEYFAGTVVMSQQSNAAV